MRPYNTRNARRGRFSQQQRQILPQRWCAFDEKVRDMMRGLYGMRKKRQHFLESLMGLLPCPYWCYLLPKVTVKGSILLGSNWPWGFGSLVKLPLWEGSWSTTYLLNPEKRWTIFRLLISLFNYSPFLLYDVGLTGSGSRRVSVLHLDMWGE